MIILHIDFILSLLGILKQIQNITRYLIRYIFEKYNDTQKRIQYFRRMEKHFSEMCSDGDMSVELELQWVLNSYQRFKILL